MSNMLVGWLPEPVILNQTGPARLQPGAGAPFEKVSRVNLSHSSAPPFNVIWAIFQVEPLNHQLSTPPSTNR